MNIKKYAPITTALLTVIALTGCVSTPETMDVMLEGCGFPDVPISAVGSFRATKACVQFQKTQATAGANTKSFAEAGAIKKKTPEDIKNLQLENIKLSNEVQDLRVQSEQAQQAKFSDTVVGLLAAGKSTSQAALGYYNSKRSKLTIGAALGLGSGDFTVIKPTAIELEAQLGDLSQVDKYAQNRYVKIATEDGSYKLYDTLNLATATSETPAEVPAVIFVTKLANAVGKKAIKDSATNKFLSALATRADDKSKQALVSHMVSNPETAKVILDDDTIRPGTSIAYNNNNTVTYTNQDRIVITKDLKAIAHNSGFDLQEAASKADVAKAEADKAGSDQRAAVAAKSTKFANAAETPIELAKANAVLTDTEHLLGLAATVADTKAKKEAERTKPPTTEEIKSAAGTIAGNMSDNGLLTNDDVTTSALTTILRASLKNPDVSSVTVSDDGKSVSYSDGTKMHTITINELSKIGRIASARAAPTSQPGNIESYTALVPDEVRQVNKGGEITTDQYESLSSKNRAQLNVLAGRFYNNSSNKYSKATITDVEQAYTAATGGLGFTTTKAGGLLDSAMALKAFDDRSSKFGFLANLTRRFINAITPTNIDNDSVAVKTISQHFGVIRHDMFEATASNGEILLFADMYSGTDKSISDVTNAYEAMIGKLGAELKIINSETPSLLRTNTRTVQLGILRTRANTALKNMKLLNNFMVTDGTEYKRRLKMKLGGLRHPTKQQAIDASNAVLRGMGASTGDDNTPIKMLLNGLKAVDKDGNIVSATPKLTNGK